MADSERALGRLDRALELVHGDEAKRLPRAAQIELRIVESGIRRDQGLADAAVLALQVPELTDGKQRPWSARLFYAYGDALLAAGRTDAAREAFSRAVVADEDEQTDALARLDELDGISVADLEDDEDEDEADGGADEDGEPVGESAGDLNEESGDDLDDDAGADGDDFDDDDLDDGLAGDEGDVNDEDEEGDLDDEGEDLGDGLAGDVTDADDEGDEGDADDDEDVSAEDESGNAVAVVPGAADDGTEPDAG
jgi:hypothetical protein